ncbi:MAG: hypothetical protein O9306_10305 [Beijerinckiaceae bacterium]|nr:hypothetical protein [Beijerinckiaceae bacterium]
MNNITISNSFDILMTIISVIIFSAIMLEIYRCFRLLYDTTWLEINSDGINYRTGFFYTKKTLKWAHVKIFKGRRGAVVYLPFERHTAGNIYQVYFILNKAFKEEYRKNIRGAENYDGHIKVHLGFDFLDTNKFIDNVDQKFTKIITENGRHPPFARFLNDVKKLCTDHPNGIVDVERT